MLQCILVTDEQCSVFFLCLSRLHSLTGFCICLLQPEILQMNIPHLVIRKYLYALVTANRMITHVFEIQVILDVTSCCWVTVSQYSFENVRKYHPSDIVSHMNS